MLRQAKTSHHKTLCEKIKNNKFTSKNWWQLVKQVSTFSGKSSKIDTLLSNDGESITEDIEKANLLNSFFVSQSELDDSNINTLPEINHDSNDFNLLHDITITANEVKDILELLNISKAIGPDNLSARLLKEASDELSPIICQFFNKSLLLNKFPNPWKIANVVPIFKKDNPKLVNNYRPISLLSIIGKVFEKCVHKKIHNYIIENKRLSPHQSGFLRGDSTINQLLYLTNEFYNALDQGKEIRVIFFDISKAFDRV